MNGLMSARESECGLSSMRLNLKWINQTSFGLGCGRISYGHCESKEGSQYTSETLRPPGPWTSHNGQARE